jgi:pimeloyl-ACP methyl ester carboxylesterase
MRPIARLSAAIILVMGCAAGSSPQRAPDDTKERSMTHQMQIDVQGAGDAPALVLVGGGLTGWRSWEPHQARLAGERRVARAQLMNVQYGLERRALPSDYSVAMEARALAAALDGAGLSDPVDLVAWSYGAFISLHFALDEPERVRTLTLIEPPATWVLAATGMMDERATAEIDAMRRLYEGMGPDDVSEDDLAEFVLQAGMCPPGESPRDLPSWPIWVEHRRSLLMGTSWTHHRDSAERLRGFAKPVLLVKGIGSSHFLRRIIDALAATLPHSELVDLPGGHAPQLVAIDAFLEHLAAFHESGPALSAR